MKSFGGRTLFLSRGFGFRFGNWHGKMGVIERDVLLNFFDGNLRSRGAALLRLLDREWIINPVHLFVVAVVQLRFLQRATDGGLYFDFQFEKGIGIEIVVTNVAVFHAQFNFIAVCTFDGVVPDQLGLVAFVFVVDEGAVNIGIDDEAFQIILGKKLGVFASAEWRNLPAGFSIVCLHLRQPLNDEFFADFVGALIFLAKIGAKGALCVLGNGAKAVNGLQLFGSAMGLNIFCYDFV